MFFTKLLPNGAMFLYPTKYVLYREPLQQDALAGTSQFLFLSVIYAVLVKII